MLALADRIDMLARAHRTPLIDDLVRPAIRACPPATAMQARRPSHFTSATNSAASGGSPAAAVASMGAMKPGLPPAACPGIAFPRACRPRHTRGHASAVTGVLTWQYLP